MEEKINCLVVLPQSVDRLHLEKFNSIYNFFWAEDDTLNHREKNLFDHPELLLAFDSGKYVQKCVQMVHTHKISMVIAITDFSAFLAAAVCQETGLPSTSVESQFLCNHKYYARIAEGEDCMIWFDYISLPESSDNSTWRDKVRYPCRVKPPCLFFSAYQSTVHNEQEMVEVLAMLRRFLPPWFSLIKKEFLGKYVDLSKYPLACSQIVVVEELVTDTLQFTVEGWADDNGKPFICAISDSTVLTHPAPHSCQFYVPSTQSQEVIETVENFVLNLAPKFKLKRTSFNVEVWYRQHQKHVQVVEINGRLFAIFELIYNFVYSLSTYNIMLEVIRNGKLNEEKSITKSKGNGAAGHFYLYIYKKGRAGDLINYKAIRETDWTEIGSVDIYGRPGVTLLIGEDDEIEAVGPDGRPIGYFFIHGRNHDEMVKKGEQVRFITLHDYQNNF